MIALILVVGSADAAVFECTYVFQHWSTLLDQYTCEARVVFNLFDQNLAGIFGSHKSGYVNGNVLGLSIQNQNMGFVTQLTDTFFPHLRGVWYYNTNITTLSSSDLRQFPYAEYIGFRYNNLERLPADLFRFNPNLKRLDMRNNKIVHVGYRILDNYGRLDDVHFNFNICIDRYGDTPATMVTLKRELNDKCPPTRDMIPSNDRFSELENEIDAMKNKIAQLELIIGQIIQCVQCRFDDKISLE